MLFSTTILLASCAKAPQKDYTPQYENQAIELPGIPNARYGSLDSFLEKELGLTANEKRILQNKFLK